MRILYILFISFVFYSFLGWCFEMVHMGITTKEIVNRGFFNGPVIPIYGVGMMLIIFLLEGIKDHVLLTTVAIIAICSILEYFTSFLMEKLFKMRWWDYEKKPLNLNGRICFETMTLFTIMALIGIYKINPAFVKFISSLNTNTLIIISMILAILFITDAIFSFSMLNKYMNSEDYTPRGDKTPAIRRFTKDIIKRNL